MGDCGDDLENLLQQWNVFHLHSILKGNVNNTPCDKI